ncbi:MAG TPA: anhydro-N-acetylmuramic acid kinase [Bacteroidales bacterium]|jgi:anhydro-N-acetylmuramic acid kinase|nr:anhydro-N-acetylmuramic acid kinase [Bacteroidales bacterium]HOS57368.1 anhydro-N-acetylmuramic acid kinase [Bacteroidales bacterium]HRT13417.1 anhydro-N-acetylmuramic acid kinase [Bacteroidales bacterium]HXK73983.1 anhydro-N-acetylmuramic acid kinase [Bacteroidales bacterium]
MKEEQFLILGLMSGTSLDGLDIVLCEFELLNKQWSYKVKKALTQPFQCELKGKLASAMEMSAFELACLDVELGKFMAHAINSFLENEVDEPMLIASHGHTIFHRPELGFSTQIGNGAVIAALTKLPVICDFRSVDVALGGQGAPLVPIGDELLFSKYGACLNLGGFSNISYREGGVRKAFDILPCNIPLNLLAQKIGFDYDNDGKMAEKGEKDEVLFQKLNQLEFYQQGNVVKSLGREWFDRHFLPILENSSIRVVDKLRTVTEHIVYQITETLNRVQAETVLVTGGGAFNKFLIELLREKNPQKEIILPDNETINFKESIVFAFLGLLRWRNEINSLKSVTGSAMDNCGGAIYSPCYKK